MVMRKIYRLLVMDVKVVKNANEEMPSDEQSFKKDPKNDRPSIFLKMIR
jgi:hypothetical protein